MANLEITLKRSLIGRKKNQIATAKALGLTKTHKTVVHSDNEAVRGMVQSISHLVEVKEV
ncbi:50S ribosomal protein L30 [Facklamia sp. DSM 111018]|uniref:Large ribosomal subunit protein uL30 n=1 Tax=Facklamia lactis TaxID=2749967 RepID=A0ABS0LT58_9LACT|nr:50S ribosomal protein L30 [Facklamia lactis]MBG9980635.1 50S ribosomal protein L30 [Facklamia lactis]MBG9986449.1 50S ribosomal protein L30 [Facklamia lactis]